MHRCSLASPKKTLIDEKYLKRVKLFFTIVLLPNCLDKEVFVIFLKTPPPPPPPASCVCLLVVVVNIFLLTQNVNSPSRHCQLRRRRQQETLQLLPGWHRFQRAEESQDSSKDCQAPGRYRGVSLTPGSPACAPASPPACAPDSSSKKRKYDIASKQPPACHRKTEEYHRPPLFRC